MKSFIFDFDGVIVDSEIHWDKHTLSTYQAIIPSFDKEYDKQLKGRSVHDIYDMIVRDFGITLSKEEYMTHIQKLTNYIYGELTLPLPGLRECIKRIQAHNVRIGIASSSQREWIMPTLKRLDLEGIFEVIVTAQDVGIGKPDPAVYLEAARQIDTPPADCIAIEDSTNGIRAAKTAGMTCIALRHAEGYVQDLSAADLIVDHFDELTEEKLLRI